MKRTLVIALMFLITASVSRAQSPPPASDVGTTKQITRKMSETSGKEPLKGTIKAAAGKNVDVAREKETAPKSVVPVEKYRESYRTDCWGLTPPL